MGNFIQDLREEAAVIGGAKWSFVTALFVVTAPLTIGAWVLSAAISGSSVSMLDERIKFKDDQIARLLGEKSSLEGLVTDIRSAMDAMAKRLDALEGKLLTGVLEGFPSSVEFLAKPNSNGILARLTGTLESSGWKVIPGTDTPATADVFQKTNTLAIITPTSPGAAETMKAALDAAQIPYEVRVDDGASAIWLKPLGDVSVPGSFQPALP